MGRVRNSLLLDTEVLERREDVGDPGGQRGSSHVVSGLDGVGEDGLLVQRVGHELLGLGVEGDGRVNGEQVCEHACGVGRCHGGTGDCVHGVLATNPGGEDVET